MIDVRNVTHHYGTRPVVRDVTLYIDAGEVLALMGPNGSGKSTLMAVMAGILWPVEGHVTINGLRRRASEEDEMAIRKQVVYLPATPWLPRSQTPRQWLLAVGRLYEIPERHLADHVERLLTLFDLQSKAESPISACSTGQQKKVALCAALVTEAPTMLLDEPFAGGLDPSGILALKKILQHRAHGDHYTIVMATPIPELVEELADRIAVMRDGQLVAHDDLANLRHLSGREKLDEIYENLVSPDTARNIERYFQMTGGGR
jgi:ABC-2 type transport system ATP-binding protein